MFGILLFQNSISLTILRGVEKRSAGVNQKQETDILPHKGERSGALRSVFAVETRLHSNVLWSALFLSLSEIPARAIEKQIGVLTGTLTNVSAMNKWPSQCNTILPSKCPPTCMAVTPSTISSYCFCSKTLLVVGRGVRQSHSRSREWT